MYQINPEVSKVKCTCCRSLPKV